MKVWHPFWRFIRFIRACSAFAVASFAVAILAIYLILASALASALAASSRTGGPPLALPILPTSPLASPSSTPTPDCGLAWRVIPSPSYDYLYRVDGVSSSDIWAVGSFSLQSVTHALMLHWDGAQWSFVPTPSIPGDSLLIGVTAISSDDVWAVGYFSPDGPERTLVEHWDGLQWTWVPSPNANQDGNILRGISAASPSDIWAVGIYLAAGNSQSLTEHWDGAQWSVVPSPSPSLESNELWDVAALANNDVWAVGFYNLNNPPDWTMVPLTMHWDGEQWSIVPSSYLQGTTDNHLRSISALSPTDVWAAGDVLSPPGGGGIDTLVEHWDGSEWSIVPSPNLNRSTDVLNGISMDSPTDGWAVGYTHNYDTGLSLTLVEHWDGSQWSIVSNPNPGTLDDFLEGVVALSSGEAWAVGYFKNACNCPDVTLVERYSDPCTPPSTASPTPSVTPTHVSTPTHISTATATATATTRPTHTNTTNTPTIMATSTSISTSGPTSTSIPVSSTPIGTSTPPATATPTATATVTSATGTSTPSPCTLTFTDVPQGSTFYPYIHCLACRGIINGYPDGTFKPSNNVTRGQLSKIVSNAAGFNDNQSTQLFQDVPVGSTFFQYIGRLASRGFINGYPCGGPGEACVPPANLPYFRPNNSSTRGQISKIVSNAAGFSNAPTGQQFEDVPAGSTYYTYTYRLVSRSVMSGYACGGTGEPCIPPANLSYFRPNNNATRGQVSKIVGNTFFPNCQTP